MMISPTLSSARTPRIPVEHALKRILVVDDEESIRVAIGKFLRSRGYEVQTAATGIEALDTLARGRFTLMLCDVRMPGLSGVDVVPKAVSLDGDLAMAASVVLAAFTATVILVVERLRVPGMGAF